MEAQGWALNSAVECHLHTVEVIGSNPIAPTILNFRRCSHLGVAACPARSRSQPDAARWNHWVDSEAGFILMQLIHVHALGVQRLVEAPVCVDRRGGWLGVTKHGLADRDVLGRFVRPRAQAVPEAVPAKTLTFGNQSQLHRRWLDEFSVHSLTPQRLFAIEVRGSEDKVPIPAVRTLVPQLGQHWSSALIPELVQLGPNECSIKPVSAILSKLTKSDSLPVAPSSPGKLREAQTEVFFCEQILQSRLVMIRLISIHSIGLTREV